MNLKIWLSVPHMGGGEKKYIDKAFDDNYVAPLGPNVDGFEQDLCQFTEAKYAAALSSGTAAIHLALILLGVQQGDEVICQSFTFSASANPIIYQGATPIFVDSEKDTWNMDPAFLKVAIEERIKIGKKPKAIIIVHLYGMPSKMDEILGVCRAYDIPVIEDAAEALGSTYHGKCLGTFGELGIYSFNGNKIITTSGGGALVSENEVFINKARFLATQARDLAPHYQHSEIGYNYRMSNICAGIGRGQLEVLDEWVKLRRANFDYYYERLSTIKGISFQEEQIDTYSNRWLTCIVIDSQIFNSNTTEILRLALEKQNIETRPLWKPMHLQPIFEKYPYYGEDIAENLFNTGLCLPSSSSLDMNSKCMIVNLLIELLTV